jgi:hypothetical protein
MNSIEADNPLARLRRQEKILKSILEFIDAHALQDAKSSAHRHSGNAGSIDKFCPHVPADLHWCQEKRENQLDILDHQDPRFVILNR